MTSPELERDNFVVLMVGQALWGEIDANMRGVAVQVEAEDSLTVHFAVRRLDSEVREDLENILSDLDANLLPRNFTIKMDAQVSEALPDWSGRQHRLVFLAKQG